MADPAPSSLVAPTFGIGHRPVQEHEATLSARAALIGATLVATTSDNGRPAWLLTRWAFTREFARLGEVERLLDTMGAPR